MGGVVRRRPRCEAAGEPRLGGARDRPVGGALLEEHLDRRVALEGGERLVVGHPGEAVRRQRDLVGAEDRLGQHRRDRPGRVERRHPVGDVEVEELGEARERSGADRLGVQTVRQRGVEVVGAGEVLQHVGEVAAGLLVLPRPGEQHRHVDLVDEQRRRGGVVDGRVVELGRLGGAHQVGVLQSQILVGGAGGVAGLDLVDGPGLAAEGVLLHPLAEPVDGEPGVEDAAGVEHGAVAVVDHRERGDRGEVRRPGLGDEQLADAGVADAGHADSVVLHPRLGGDRLDHVVAVVHLRLVEEGVGPAAASRAAHVDPDVGVAEGVDELREADRARVARAVARVLDQRRVRPVGRIAGQRHPRRQRGAVAHGDVPEAGLDVLVVVERLLGHVGRRHDRERGRRRGVARQRVRARRGPPGRAGCRAGRCRRGPTRCRRRRAGGRACPAPRPRSTPGGCRAARSTRRRRRVGWTGGGRRRSRSAAPAPPTAGGRDDRGERAVRSGGRAWRS